MRLTLVWTTAARFPPTMVITASNQMIALQWACTTGRATPKRRTKAAKAASLVPTDIIAVTGVGDPSYTSGVQAWKGMADILKAKPTIIRPMPAMRTGSLVEACALRNEAICGRLVEPVAP